MADADRAVKMRSMSRKIEMAVSGDEDLGPLKWLPGTWENQSKEVPQGWNMIALPFDDAPFRYRMYLNHYRETLKFTEVNKAVPNRGLRPDGDAPVGEADGDQFIVTLDYLQTINHVASIDSPETQTLRDPDGAGIHHEPGLFLNMTNLVTKQINIARLGTIPHGNSILAMGAFREEGFGADIFDGPPTIPDTSGLPVGVPIPDDLSTIGPDSGYLGPYGTFNQNPFKGTVPAAGFPGFNPVFPARLLQLSLDGLADQGPAVTRTTRLGMSTNVMDGDISNIPFIVREANATLMDSTFWIMELDAEGIDGDPKLMMMYLQIVNLDFFPRVDGTPGLIAWPHVSINTMVKTANPPKPSA